jgi:hypothetical protein
VTAGQPALEVLKSGLTELSEICDLLNSRLDDALAAHDDGATATRMPE